MFRFVTSFAIASVFAATLWHNYAPAQQQAQLPEELRLGIVLIDETLRGGIDFVVNFGAASETADQTKIDVATPLSQETTPLTIVSADGIETVYHDLTPQSLMEGGFEATALLGAELHRANFSNANLQAVLLDGAMADEAVFGDARMSGASARTASFKGAFFYRTDLRGAAMEGARFDGAIFNGSRLARAGFSAASMTDVVVRGGDGRAASFRRSRLDGAQFEGVSLKHADFTRASLRRTTFRSADLTGTTWEGADLSGAILTSATGLTAASLIGACGDAETALPEGLAPLRNCQGRGRDGLVRGERALAQGPTGPSRDGRSPLSN